MSVDIATIKDRLSLVSIIEASGLKLRKEGSDWVCRCPNAKAHQGGDDSTPSFHIHKLGGVERFHCFGCGMSGDVIDWIQQTEGLDMRAAIQRAAELAGVPQDNGHKRQEKPNPFEDPGPPTDFQFVESYPYVDEQGELVYTVERHILVNAETGDPVLKNGKPKKTFRQKRASDGEYTIQGTRRLLYRLPQVLDSDTVWIVEGEKDVHTLEKYGLVATTKSGGASAKWQNNFNDWLKGKRVILCPDTDIPGQKSAEDILEHIKDVAAAVEWVDLGKDFKDVTEFLEARTLADLVALVGPPPAAPTPILPDKVKDVKVCNYNFTDGGNAERLLAVYGGDIRFCVEWREWVVWSKKRWIRDRNDSVRHLCLLAMREFYRQSANIEDEEVRKVAEKWARRSESTAACTAMMAAARAMPGVSISATEFDRDPWLFNCANGTLDLHTGSLRTHKRDDLITKMSPVEYRAGATAPRWEGFLREILVKPRLIEWIKRAFGYSLTGLVTEKLIICFFGEGDNGKTTLLETFRGVVGDYGSQVLIDTLTAKQESVSALADLADLMGARFVTTSEAEEGSKLNEGKIKYITGMGTIKSCRKYENHIEFMPTHKIFLDANHRPQVRGTDRAIWSRLKPIPFEVSIPPEQIDRNLASKLAQEAPGILAWAVEGCLEWQRAGLGDLPTEVAGERDKWRVENDPLRDFLDECCTLDPDSYELVSRMWKRYTDWCRESGEKYQLGRNKFGDRLESLGCRRMARWVGSQTQKTWEGIGFK